MSLNVRLGCSGLPVRNALAYLFRFSETNEKKFYNLVDSELFNYGDYLYPFSIEFSILIGINFLFFKLIWARTIYHCILPLSLSLSLSLYIYIYIYIYIYFTSLSHAQDPLCPVSNRSYHVLLSSVLCSLTLVSLLSLSCLSLVTLLSLPHSSLPSLFSSLSRFSL